MKVSDANGKQYFTQVRQHENGHQQEPNGFSLLSLLLMHYGNGCLPVHARCLLGPSTVLSSLWVISGCFLNHPPSHLSCLLSPYPHRAESCLSTVFRQDSPVRNQSHHHLSNVGWPCQASVLFLLTKPHLTHRSQTRDAFPAIFWV